MKSVGAIATASESGHSRDRPARLRSRCLGPPFSEAPARKSGPRRRHILGGRQHPPDSRRAPTAAQGRASLQECGVACGGHAEGRPGSMADAFTRRPRRDLRLPRWLRPASAHRREGGQRAGARRGRCPLRRGTNICAPWTCAEASRSRRGKAASTISWREDCGRRCWRSSMAMLGSSAPSGWRGQGLRSNAVASTNFGISSARRRSTCSPRSATTSIASCTRPLLTRPALLRRPSSARGSSAAQTS